MYYHSVNVCFSCICVCVWLTGVQVLQRRDPAGSLTQVSCISQVSNTGPVVGYLYCLWVNVVYNTLMYWLVCECHCLTTKCRQKSPSGHHRTTMLGYIFATKHVSTIGKDL